MNKILVLLVMAISLSCFGQEEPQRCTKDFGLRGKVKSVKKRLYKPKDNSGFVDKESRIFETLADQTDNYQLFNNKGLLLKSGNLNKNDSIIVTLSITYNSKDSITEEVYYDETGESFRRDYFVYDDKGNKIESGSLYANDAASSYINKYKYNLAGKPIEELYSIMDGSSQWRVEISYNNKGLNDTITTFDIDSNIVEMRTYKYDKSNEPAEISVYGEGAKLLFKYSVKNDPKNNSKETNIIDASGNTLLNYTDYFNSNKQFIKKHNVTRKFEIKGFVLYKYNSKGVLIEEISNTNEGEQTTKRVYDDYGNELEFQMFKFGGTDDYKITYTYEYDDKGNWVKSVMFTNSEPELVITREIEYY